MTNSLPLSTSAKEFPDPNGGLAIIAFPILAVLRSGGRAAPFPSSRWPRGDQARLVVGLFFRVAPGKEFVSVISLR